MILLMLSIGWAQSYDWKTKIWELADSTMSSQVALPPLLKTARELYPNVENWDIIDVDVDFTKEVVSRYFIRSVERGIGVAPKLRGMSELIDRSSIQLTPRESPGWGEVASSSYMPEGTSYKQFGTARYYREGDLEAISIDVRHWESELAYMYSEHQYCSTWTFARYIFLYRGGVSLGAYLHESIIVLYPEYTDEEWKSQKTIRSPDWTSLMMQPGVYSREHVFQFRHNKEGSLDKVDLFEYVDTDRPSHSTYKPVATAPPAP